MGLQEYTSQPRNSRSRSKLINKCGSQYGGKSVCESRYD
mgnify:CR=1 FL=1